MTLAKNYISKPILHPMDEFHDKEEKYVATVAVHDDSEKQSIWSHRLQYWKGVSIGPEYKV